MSKKRKLKDVQILGICHFVALVLLSVYGTQVFEIAEAFPNTVARILLPINRSIWEMSKMLVMPLCIIFTIEYFIVGKRLKNFIPAHVIIAFILPVALILIALGYEAVFHTLSMEGAHAAFFVTLLLASFFASILLVTSEKDLSKYFTVFLILYILLCVAYVIFSFNTPRMRMFFDTVNQSFGPLFIK